MLLLVVRKVGGGVERAASRVPVGRCVYMRVRGAKGHVEGGVRGERRGRRGRCVCGGGGIDLDTL